MFMQLMIEGVLCTGVAASQVQLAITERNNPVLKLDDMRTMVAANREDNPSQTYESIYFLFKMVALYGSIFVTKMTMQQLLDSCAALRLSRYSPPSLEGLPSLWISLKDILRPVSHFQQYREFKSLFFKAVEKSVTPATFVDFKMIAEVCTMSLSHGEGVPSFEDYSRVVNAIVAKFRESYTVEYKMENGPLKNKLKKIRVNPEDVNSGMSGSEEKEEEEEVAFSDGYLFRVSGKDGSSGGFGGDNCRGNDNAEPGYSGWYDGRGRWNTTCRLGSL
jgi:hypothetical protein